MDPAEGSKSPGGKGEGGSDIDCAEKTTSIANIGGIPSKASRTPGSATYGGTRRGNKKTGTASPVFISNSSSSASTSHVSSTSIGFNSMLGSSEEESEAEIDDEDSHSSFRSSHRRRPTPLQSSARELNTIKAANTHKPAFEITTKAATCKTTMIKTRELTAAPGLVAAARAGHFSDSTTHTGRESDSTIHTGRESDSTTHTGRDLPDTSGPVARPIERPHRPLNAQCPPRTSVTATTTPKRRRRHHHHLPRALPTFRDSRMSMWTSTHDANAPSEDRSSSLLNVLLRPPRSRAGTTTRNLGETENVSSSGSSGSCSGDEGVVEQPSPQNDEVDNTSLIRLSLWAVVDGHGGGCVATYASEVLLPHIAASVARALKCAIVDRGVCTVNGQLRDANALDLDGLIRSSDRSRTRGSRSREAGIDVVNPNAIHYRAPGEDSESEEEAEHGGDEGIDHAATSEEENDGAEPPVSVASSILPRNPPPESASSVKTSVKTAVSPATQHAPVGTHSHAEVADITRAITQSFLSVDEGWINSIDPITTHQTSCVSNGRWNAGACALVVFTVQRLDWTRSSMADPETDMGDRGAGGGEDTSHNRDAARRRKLDYATKSKSVSSLSTLSSTSSLATAAMPTNVSVQESEITETEDDDDVSDIFGPRRRNRNRGARDDPHHQGGVVISTPGGCKCHYYRPHDAMLYTAHVGDCRAVMLGSAPPRTIKVRPEGDPMDHADTSDDDSSCDSSSKESDGMSSSDHDTDSSDDDEDEEDLVAGSAASGNYHYMNYMRRPAKRQCHRGAAEDAMTNPPFVPLPPLSRSGSSDSEESETESDDSTATTAALPKPQHKTIRCATIATKRTAPKSPSPTLQLESPSLPPPLPLSPLMRPIDLTTDHSAYNPAEVTAVLRRCNNAPRAISSASGGGIKRVAGSLAVTRALGDAYLKTPHLSFFPYKRHAPYITARPEVNCRLLTKGGDRVLILATDGVWERATGDDVLRWVRNYYNQRIAGVEKHHYSHHLKRTRRTQLRNRHRLDTDDSSDSNAEIRRLALPPSSANNESLSGHKRKRGSSSGVAAAHDSNVSARTGARNRSSNSQTGTLASVSTVSDVIVRRVLNKVRRARNMPSLRALMALPKGRARRSKHDDITAVVVDMSGFVS